MRKKNVSYEEIKRRFGPDPTQKNNQPIQAAKMWKEIIYDYLNVSEEASENTKNPTPAKRKWDS